jgi:hypothetical protein
LFGSFGGATSFGDEPFPFPDESFTAAGVGAGKPLPGDEITLLGEDGKPETTRRVGIGLGSDTKVGKSGKSTVNRWLSSAASLLSFCSGNWAPRAVKDAQPPITAVSEAAVISIFTPAAPDEDLDRFGLGLDDMIVSFYPKNMNRIEAKLALNIRG